ncbi:hypothetical protein OJF2_45270 [Aquisphaera giovannonii]|uniref:DUF4261 domain-containing protein n=1 Tax=Aquisphaera giovannonii TaxID=406548 RepID=A0A5B9W760_9BACT|nr:DUF4261 domain-containing protein [Aquisphaera giovannonii]QEH35969.1 hypothetical protein OJF2_45270 [Aquisphaera giovannonii]
MDQATGGFARTYGVELLFEWEPTLDADELLRAVRERRPSAELMGRPDEATTLGFAHPDLPVRMKDGSIPAQTHLLWTEKPFEFTEIAEEDLGQSWQFPEAREVVGLCRHRLLLTDLMSSPLPPADRLGVFEDVLAGVLRVLPASAIHWRPTGQFIDPDAYLQGYDKGGAARFFAGALNVRFYNVQDAPGDVLMDTLGLGALGLPDLQCHYRGLEPGRVAAMLANTAYYVFERGDVIEDGHTVEGPAPGSRWRCRHEESLLKPSRVVLDIDPGPPHAAGRR